jgi:hypothetical protein
LAAALGLVASPAIIHRPATPATRAEPWANAARPETRHVVFLAGSLSRQQLVVLSASLAASQHPGILLIDSPKSTPYHKLFLQNYHPDSVVPVGSFGDGIADLEKRLAVTTAPPVEWKDGLPLDLWQQLFPRAERVVVCPAEPYSQLLQAACLAGSTGAPLFVASDNPGQQAELKRLLGVWQTKTVYGIGNARAFCPHQHGVSIISLKDAAAVAAENLQVRAARATVNTIVVTNAADIDNGGAVMSALAPWIAAQRRAPLLLTNAKGTNVAKLVRANTRKRELRKVDNVILLADLNAIPMEQRVNPIKDGKDPFIEMEPLTPMGNEPFTFAVGRLFNDDQSVVTLVLARERLLARERHLARQPRKALVVSNAAGGLPLLEAFSRNTAQELRNCGYDTTALYGNSVSKEELRRLLPDQDIFLWEGHHNTLIKEYHMHEWTEPLQPSLIFLQSCLALKDWKAQPIIERGALGVVGSSTRIYSASGGAFALSFFDSMMYDGQSMGGSLRHAKNFLLAYSLLKEKRLGKDAHLSVANLRSAWAFTLWGDPTLRLPAPPEPSDALPAVDHHVSGNTIHIRLPHTSHEKALTARYKAQMLPNGRLAGLITKMTDDNRQKLVPFVFAEVSLPHAPAGKEPRLTTKLPSNRWVFCWDARRRCGYLLATPRASDNDELRFHVSWDAGTLAADD